MSAEIEKVNKARLAIAKSESVEDVIMIKGDVEAIKVLMRKRGASMVEQNECAETAIWATVRAGDLLSVRDMHKGGNPNLSHDSTGCTLDDIGITRNDSSRWQRISAYNKNSPGNIEAHIDKVKEKGEELTQAGILRLATNLNIQSSASVEWYTPEKYIEAARQTMGSIDLDPASCALANKTVKAGKYFDLETDGLSQSWGGNVWLNPPYGSYGPPFVNRLVEEYASGNVGAGIMALNSHATDAAWFKPLWDHTICFTDHRPKFISGENESSQPTHGAAFVYLGNDPGMFKQYFSPFGAVVRRI